MGPAAKYWRTTPPSICIAAPKFAPRRRAHCALLAQGPWSLGVFVDFTYTLRQSNAFNACVTLDYISHQLPKRRLPSITQEEATPLLAFTVRQSEGRCTKYSHAPTRAGCFVQSAPPCTMSTSILSRFSYPHGCTFCNATPTHHYTTHSTNYTVYSQTNDALWVVHILLKKGVHRVVCCALGARHPTHNKDAPWQYQKPGLERVRPNRREERHPPHHHGHTPTK